MLWSDFIKNQFAVLGLFVFVGTISWFFGIAAVILLDNFGMIELWGPWIIGGITLTGICGYFLTSYHIVVRRNCSSRLQYLVCSLLPPAALITLGYVIVRGVRFGW